MKLNRRKTIFAVLVVMLLMMISGIALAENGNHLIANCDGDGGSTKYVYLNDTMELKVVASCDVGDIHYQWYKLAGPANETVGTDQNTYTIEPVVKKETYYCVVSDEFGNSVRVYFYIRVENELKAERVGNYTVDVTPGESITLEVTSSCKNGDIHYQWYSDWNVIAEGENTAKYTTVPLLKKSSIKCVVTDDYENTDTVYFDIVLNHFKVSESKYYHVDKDTVLTLTADATHDMGSLTYEWHADGSSVIVSTDSTIETDSLTKKTNYSCRVSDEYGNIGYVYHYINIENDFYAKELSSTSVFVPLNETTVLEIEAGGSEGDIHYQWYYSIYDPDNWNELLEGGKLEGETVSKLTTKPVTFATSYYCIVNDDFGNEKVLTFSVYVDSGLKVTGDYGDDYSTVHQGDTIIMNVYPTVNIGNIRRTEWNIYDDLNGETYIGDGVTTYVIDSIQSYTSVYFYAYDDFGNNYSRWFHISIDNGFTAYPIGENKREVKTGEEIILEVSATADEGELSYRWSSEVEDFSSTESSLVISPVKDDFITCSVTDKYGATIEVEFTIVIADEQKTYTALSLNQPVRTTERIACFSFTPSKHGIYVCGASTGENGCIQLSDNNGRMLTESWSGLTGIYLGDDEYKTIACGTQITWLMTAEKNYSILVFTAGEEVTVTLTCKEIIDVPETILSLPESLKRIDSEAFSGTESVQAIRIPSSVTSIASTAITDKSILIIAPDNSYAEQWGRNNGFRVLVGPLSAD